MAPKKAPPPLPPDALDEYETNWVELTWGRLFPHTLLRNEEEVRRWVADERRRWAAAEKLRRRIRELPAAAKAA